MAEIILYGSPLWSKSLAKNPDFEVFDQPLLQASTPQELSSFLKTGQEVLILAEKQYGQLPEVSSVLSSFKGNTLLMSGANYPMVKAACLFIGQIDFSALGKTLQAEARSAIQIIERGSLQQ